MNDNIALSEIGVTTTVLQRYALAVLYYSTDGQNWKGDLNFLSNSDICTWNNGLIQRNENESLALMVFFCNGDETVDLIQFIGAGLNGTIPWEISLLSDLIQWNVMGNSLHGTIPTEFGKLIFLERLSFADNSLSASIPTELGLGLFECWISTTTFSREVYRQSWYN